MSINMQEMESYIKKHREAFDIADVPACGWEHTVRALDHAGNDALLLFIGSNRPLLDTEVPAAEIWNKIDAVLGPAQQRPQDKLEQFITQNQSAFDTEIPDLNVWEKLAPAKPVKPALHISWPGHIMRAAAAILLLATGAAWGMWYMSQQQDTMATSGMSMGDVSSDYAKLEQQYEREIAQKKKQLAQFTSSTTVPPSEVFTDLDEMDRVMQELRNELANVPPGNREQVVRAMIDNYKAKAEVLSRVLEALESSDNTPSKKERNNSKYDNDTI